MAVSIGKCTNSTITAVLRLLLPVEVDLVTLLLKLMLHEVSLLLSKRTTLDLLVLDPVELIMVAAVVVPFFLRAVVLRIIILRIALLPRKCSTTQ
jgi:hypothetical protein